MWKKVKQYFKHSKEKSYTKDIVPPPVSDPALAEPDKTGLSRPRGLTGRPSLDKNGLNGLSSADLGLGYPWGAARGQSATATTTPAAEGTASPLSTTAASGPLEPTVTTASNAPSLYYTSSTNSVSNSAGNESSTGGIGTTSSKGNTEIAEAGSKGLLLKPTCPSSAIKLSPDDLENEPPAGAAAVSQSPAHPAPGEEEVPAAGAAAAAGGVAAADGARSDSAGTGSSSGGSAPTSSAGGANSSSSRGPEPNHTPRDIDLQGCPPYATKAVWGLRYTMEDKWAAVPNLVQVPSIYTTAPSKRSHRASAAAACSCIKAKARGDKQERQPIISVAEDEDMDSLHYFGVFDGHGGAEAAKFCASRMHGVVLDEINAVLGASASNKAIAPGPSGEWMCATLVGAFVALDREFAAVSEGTYVGTTAVVVVLGRQRMWVAHCGDSRCVLSRNGDAVAITQDHKASREDEVARVQAAGGHVWWDRVMGELAVSRAIGDHCLRPYVIPEPEVSMLECTAKDELLVMASDGLWDVMSNQEAAEMALHSLVAAEGQGLAGVAAVKKASYALTKAALDRGTRDNVTVLVVDLRNHH